MPSTPFSETSILKPELRYKVPAQVVVENSTNFRRLPISHDFLIDTGFNLDLFVSADYKPQVDDLGVRVYPTSITVADGRQVPAWVCSAELHQLGKEKFDPALRAELMMCGISAEAVLGLRLLTKWIAEFHGPQEILRLFKNEITPKNG